MTRRLLDARIRTHQTIAKADEAIRKAEARRSHLGWLESLVRAGQPLPGTPEWHAETAATYARMDRAELPSRHSSGGMDWDGIWRSNVKGKTNASR